MQIKQTSTSLPQAQPLVSFIITDYNIPLEMLEKCVKSIFDLSLNASEVEVVIVDDGSDISPINDIDAAIERQDAIIYVRQKNQGLSVARNTGLKVANGKYIQFVDGDDYLLRAPYEHCLDIVRYHEPDMVLFDYTSKKEVEIPFAFEGPISGSSYLHNHNIKAVVWSYIFKRKILGNLRFTPNLSTEDEEFTPQLLLRADTLYATDSKAYFYRMRKSSLTHDKGKERKEKRLNDAMSVIIRLQELSQNLPKAERVALERRIHQLSMDLIYNTIKSTHSEKHLDATITKLRDRGLFPLPDRKYTRKYSLFRKMVNSAIGRKILLISIGR
jgi:glycosyltransferase involved in cell wall biosynthesis